MLLHANSKVTTVKLRNTPCLIKCSNEIDIFIGKIAYTVCMFHHGEIQLLPHAPRIAQHRDRTRRWNSAFPFQLVFRILSCVFSFGAHISSWSRTRDATLIRGLNHAWNRAFIKIKKGLRWTVHTHFPWRGAGSLCRNPGRNRPSCYVQDGVVGPGNFGPGKQVKQPGNNRLCGTQYLTCCHSSQANLDGS